MPMISVVLVDDHALVRQGIRGLIEQQPDVQVIAECSNGSELLQALPAYQPQPDLIIMDLTMPVMNGKEALQALIEKEYGCPVLMLSMNEDDATILELVRLGARGYLPKYCSTEELHHAIQDIVHTGYYHSELEHRALFKSFRKSAMDQQVPHLTAREMEFLLLVCDKEELSYKLIAERMKVSARTIDGYREALFEKFNVKSKLGLVFYALRHGLIKLDDI